LGTRFFQYVFLAITLLATGCQHPFSDQVQSLLNETGAEYELHDLSGGWIKREMHCRISILPDELTKVVTTLGLSEPLPYFNGETRLITVSDSPCSSHLRKRYSKAFGIQQWTPTRHGFSSAILFYNETTHEGCLFLSIAYG
jgi:hypothetical protein